VSKRNEKGSSAAVVALSTKRTNKRLPICSPSPPRKEPRAHHPLTVPETDRNAFITHNCAHVAAPQIGKSEVAFYSDTFSATNEMKDKANQCDNEQQVDESSSDVKGKSTAPK
jgi:hypothetical protein